MYLVQDLAHSRHTVLLLEEEEEEQIILKALLSRLSVSPPRHRTGLAPAGLGESLEINTDSRDQEGNSCPIFPSQEKRGDAPTFVLSIRGESNAPSENPKLLPNTDPRGAQAPAPSRPLRKLPEPKVPTLPPLPLPPLQPSNPA